jgi:ATP/maltotriose-dependent transcriptional regulator MalT
MSLNAALTMIASCDEDYLHEHIRNSLAELEFELGNPRAALAIANELIARASGTDEVFNYLSNACAYRIALGEIHEAKIMATRLIDLLRGRRPIYSVIALEHVATIAALDGQPEPAARLRGYTEKVGRRLGYVREQTEEHCYAIGTAALCRQCSDDQLQNWMIDGARLSEQEAIGLASAVEEGRPTLDRRK